MVTETLTDRYDAETSVIRDDKTGRWHVVEQRVDGCCEMKVRYSMINPRNIADTREMVTKQEVF